MRFFGEHANDSRLARSNPAEDADDHGVFPVRGPRSGRLRISAVPGWSTPTTFDSNAEVPKDTRKKRGLGVILEGKWAKIIVNNGVCARGLAFRLDEARASVTKY